jgi:hypothetical protein
VLHGGHDVATTSEAALHDPDPRAGAEAGRVARPRRGEAAGSFAVQERARQTCGDRLGHGRLVHGAQVQVRQLLREGGRRRKGDGGGQRAGPTCRA